jgi:plasmid replication initiation protein
LIAWRSVGKTPEIKLRISAKNGGFRWEYQRMGQFKEKVLHIAIEQINEHTDITAEYEQHKEGRSIVGFSFKFKQKQQPKIEKPKDLKRDPNTPDFL